MRAIYRYFVVFVALSGFAQAASVTESPADLLNTLRSHALVLNHLYSEINWISNAPSLQQEAAINDVIKKTLDDSNLKYRDLIRAHRGYVSAQILKLLIEDRGLIERFALSGGDLEQINDLVKRNKNHIDNITDEHLSLFWTVGKNANQSEYKSLVRKRAITKLMNTLAPIVPGLVAYFGGMTPFGEITVPLGFSLKEIDKRTGGPKERRRKYNKLHSKVGGVLQLVVFWATLRQELPEIELKALRADSVEWLRGLRERARATSCGKQLSP